MNSNMQRQKIQLYCPKCGEEVERLFEGYCEECLEEMQLELWRQNVETEAWQKFSDRERDARIKNVVRFG